MANTRDFSGYCISRTKEALQLAQDLSEYVRSLPLTNEQNDKLVSMMADCTQARIPKASV